MFLSFGPTFAGKDLYSYPDQICGGRTRSASVICPPGPNLLALSVPPDQIRGRTDFTVTPARPWPCQILLRVTPPFPGLCIAHAHTYCCPADAAKQPEQPGKR